MKIPLDAAVQHLPRRYPGPGGACAVLREGAILEHHAWGYANAERRIAFTPDSLFRMCSITKQFTCGLVLDAFPDPALLDQDVQGRLHQLKSAAPSALHLCHNQSGLRDYWAVAMLHGSPVEAPFGDIEARFVIDGARTLQFEPGTAYSYCNQNFRILSDILQNRTGRSFAELLRERMFAPAGMETAFLAADTTAMPDGTTGYEGSQAAGFRAAENRILWTGDAGLGASLNDMIAWEHHIDSHRNEPASFYNRLSGPVTFADGSVASYGFGLQRTRYFGRLATGHGGALRGWRSHRMYLPEERISIVVLLNHLSDAHQAAVDLLAATLGEQPTSRPDVKMPDWLGHYIDDDSGLSAMIEPAGDGKIRVRYGNPPELLDVREDGSAGSETLLLRAEPGGLLMDRATANVRVRLQSCRGEPRARLDGRYYCEQLDAYLTVVDTGGALYGGFSGRLGQGRMELLAHVGADVWTLPCPRALDHTPPGDWTLNIQSIEDGHATSLLVGCLIARGLRYTRVF